jgi:ankyrin repeat protein
MGMVRALLSAATRGKVDELRQLVARSDAEVLGSVRTPKFDTAVHIAALHGHSRFVSEALSLNRELLVSRNSDGDTPLHLAARAGKERVARLLAGLAQGWTFDASSRDDGFQVPPYTNTRYSLSMRILLFQTARQR